MNFGFSKKNREKDEKRLKEIILRLPDAKAEDLAYLSFERFTKAEDKFCGRLKYISKLLDLVINKAMYYEDIFLIQKTDSVIQKLNQHFRPIEKQLERVRTEYGELNLNREIVDELWDRIGQNKFLREKMNKKYYCMLNLVKDAGEIGLELYPIKSDYDWMEGLATFGKSKIIFSTKMDFFDFKIIVPSGPNGEEVLGGFSELFSQLPNFVYKELDDPTRIISMYLLGSGTYEEEIDELKKDTTKKVLTANYVDEDPGNHENYFNK
jgi:hypothetical protein